jgi:CO/xanthine dehydrogenase FAD-binding subunit
MLKYQKFMIRELGMKAFNYIAPQSIDEVTVLLSQNDSQVRILAGGTDLLAQMRENRRIVDLMVDVKQIPELNELTYNSVDGLTVGAAVSCLRICNNPMIAKHYCGLTDAIALIGGIQIQGRATLGGNLVNASPAADSIPALIVHDAQCLIAGPGGVRSVSVETFCLAPGQTVLQKGEFVVSFHIKPPVRGFGAHYLRFIPRNEMDIAVVGAGAAVILDEDGMRFRSVRVALGAVAPIPLFIYEVGEFLAGKPASKEMIDQAADIAAQAAKPISDVRGTVEQRKHLARVLTRRALFAAFERAQQSLGGK